MISAGLATLAPQLLVFEFGSGYVLRPPQAMPTADSMKHVSCEQPNRLPKTQAKASTKTIRWSFGAAATKSRNRSGPTASMFAPPTRLAPGGSWKPRRT